jgi:hypothetical protein
MSDNIKECFPTDPRYWECECEHNYIHNKTADICPLCETHQDDQPDARIHELLNCIELCQCVLDDFMQCHYFLPA